MQNRIELTECSDPKKNEKIHVLVSLQEGKKEKKKEAKTKPEIQKSQKSRL